jgi:two-component system response regulator RegA
MSDDSRQDDVPTQRQPDRTPSLAAASFERALVVEDGERLRTTVAEYLQPWAREVRTCGSLAAALDLVAGWHPDLMVLDFRLPDGDARELLRRVAGHGSVATTIAMSAFAKPRESFELAGLGVRAYLEKPFSRPDLDAALGQALAAPDLTPQLRNAVGKAGLQEVEDDVRRTMVAEALSRAKGSRRGAARLLRVSRQFLQHALRKLFS